MISLHVQECELITSCSQEGLPPYGKAITTWYTVGGYGLLWRITCFLLSKPLAETGCPTNRDMEVLWYCSFSPTTVFYFST